ncbi:MAG: hypothetical protein ACPLX8_01585, partial [Nanopusillaceae archaeon]
EFDNFYLELYNSIIGGEYNNDMFEKSIEMSNKLSKIRNLELDSLCDSSKKTKNSIFFDKDEMSKLITVIGLIKLYAPFMYSKYSDYITVFIDRLDRTYKDILSKLYKIIKTKVKTTNYKQMLNMWKLDISLDYISLYNFEFILLTSLVFYNWSTNPLSFIVSMSSDLTNFWIMTLEAYPYSYSNDIMEVELEDFIDVMSYEIILDQIDAGLNKLYDMNNYNINYNLYLTQVNQLISLPLISMMSDISLNYLEQKTKQDKINYQILVYYLATKSELIKNLLGEAIKLFLYGYTKSTASTSMTSPYMLEVLKPNINYYQLNSKVPLLNLAQELCTVVIRHKNLENLITGNSFRTSPEMLDRIGKDLVKFLTYMFDERVKEEIKSEGKKLFLNFLSNIDISKNNTIAKII